eukprot:CAMPEP_0117450756 /NCGR_PEP_ID=MMETSP0759-20121206/8639_1 /TAXON_ID=63605 /ORGANISM="Percolomonas cosmopolitus, Strain WS" /LENGTH=118 /DNA_ID=CAMNT_0005243301 /DNA_START=137 /DNA_END=493 /DNA_ORIENTATION=-
MTILNVGSLAYKRRIFTLYKQTLKNLRDQIANRNEFCLEHPRIRAEFDMYMRVKDPEEATFLLERAELHAVTFKAPVPYFFPEEEGGVAFMRYGNPPTPEQVKGLSVLTERPQDYYAA